jgi:hypothetical protein
MVASWPTWAAVAGARLEAHATIPRTIDIRLLSICSQIEPLPAAKVPIDFPIRFFVHRDRLGEFRGFECSNLAASLIRKVPRLPRLRILPPKRPKDWI